MSDLEQTIRDRHSTRLFLPRPVPRALVDEAIALAVCAPSNSNIQPWHMPCSKRPKKDHRTSRSFLSRSSCFSTNNVPCPCRPSCSNHEEPA